MAVDTLSAEDKVFLAQCEEEFRDRFTEKDEEFMKVFNGDPLKPPVIDSWMPQNFDRRRNDRRHNRRFNPYERSGNRDRRDNRDNRGYNDYNRRHDDHSDQRHRHRYY